MIRLRLMLAEALLPAVALSIFFFAFILNVGDLFANLWRYLNQGLTPAAIAVLQLLYLPRCLVWGAPIGFLFAAAYSLGDLYARNELIAVLNAGVSILGFTRPLLIVALFLTVATLVFEDQVVLPALQRRIELTNVLMNYNPSFNNTNVVILSHEPGLVYQADYYNDERHEIIGFSVYERDASGDLVAIYQAERAVWRDGRWQLYNLSIDRLTAYGFRTKRAADYSDTRFTDPPSSFRRQTRSVDAMRTGEALAWIEGLRRSGLPYKEAQTELYKRFSHALVYLVVAFVSLSFAGRFRRNVLLLSLLISLSLTVAFYVLQMVLGLLARLGYISPLIGAFGAFALFMASGLALVRTART